MASRPDLGFPDDLINAWSLRDALLSFSTIQVGDTNPDAGARGGAEGSVGLVVDLAIDTVVQTVHHGDSGSAGPGSLGSDATLENAAASIDRRRDSNEWRIANYAPVGILILLPIRVRVVGTFQGEPTSGYVPLELAAAMQPFQERRIFGMDHQRFLELDRASGEWRRVSYDQMIRPRAWMRMTAIRDFVKRGVRALFA